MWLSHVADSSSAHMIREQEKCQNRFNYKEALTETTFKSDPPCLYVVSMSNEVKSLKN